MSCLNRKVLAVVSGGLVAVLVLAPSAFGRLAPLLVAAACPLGMLFMMRSATSCGRRAPGARPGADEAELAQLRAKVARLEAGSAAAPPADGQSSA